MDETELESIIFFNFLFNHIVYSSANIHLLFSPQNNSANKDGSNHKAEVTAMIEAAKSKIHQVRGNLEALNVL